MQGAICFAYTKNFKILDLKLHKSQKLVYECAKVIIWNNELRKGFYPHRFNNPTKKGTSIKFKLIVSAEQCDEEFMKLNSYLEELKVSGLFSNYEKTKE